MTELKHSFYLKNKKEQQWIQYKIAGGAIVINLIFLLLFVSIGWYLIPFLILAITLSIIAPFFDTPSLVDAGQLIYYSPFFLVEKEKNGVITIHGGTLFDYCFALDKELSGQQRTNCIIKGYLDGLLGLIAQYEQSIPNSIKVKGTSYIINERTAHKLGFVKTKTALLQVFILRFNCINLLITHSIAKAKLSFPNLKNIHSFEGKMDDLIQQKAYLLRLRTIVIKQQNKTQ